MTDTHPDFNTAIHQAHELMRNAPVFNVQRWQGVDVSKKPEMATHEIRHFFIDVPMPTEHLDYYRQQIVPNLPWADDHFLERVCGQPINPGIQWKHWPYALSADKFRSDVRRMPSHDWSYLAGIIDGEGSIGLRTANGDKQYPRIKITQVDEAFITTLFHRWGVGTLRPYSSPSNQLSDRQSYIWRISAQAEVRWVLEGCLPYLRLKRSKALEMLNYLPEGALMEEGDPYNHNYMERYFPKWARSSQVNSAPHSGICHPYGDLNDVVNQLVRDPTTRQAILPVFFPEDTGAVHLGRVPCSLFYQFLMREGKMDITYMLRSCDILRHFRDDIYLTVRLALWVLDECRKKNKQWRLVKPGNFVMLISSLHCFRNDHQQLFGGM